MKISTRNRRQRSDIAYKLPRDPHVVTLDTRSISLLKQKKTAKLRALGYTDTQITMIERLMEKPGASAAYDATQGTQEESQSIDGLSMKRSGKKTVITFHHKPV